MVRISFTLRSKIKSFALDTAHVLPVLFSFTTPGKFCYRAIASFTKHVTGMNALSRSSSSPMASPTTSALPSHTVVGRFSMLSRALSTPEFLNRIQGKSNSLTSSNVPDSACLSPLSSTSLLPPLSRPSVPKSASDNALFESTLRDRSSDNVNLGGKGIKGSASDFADTVQRFAGESKIYCDDEVCFTNYVVENPADVPNSFAESPLLEGRHDSRKSVNLRRTSTTGTRGRLGRISYSPGNHRSSFRARRATLYGREG